MLSILKKPLSIFIIIFLIALGIGGYFYFTRKTAPKYEFTSVSKGNLVQEVSATGKVEPATNVELSFEKTGRITQAKFKVGDIVKTGTILAALENGDLRAQLTQANAGIDAQQAKLDELKKGTRPEEIQVAQTTLDNAQKSLIDAQTNLTNVKNKADADLKEEYDAALTSTNDSVTNAIYSLFVLTDIQYTYFPSSSDTDSIRVADAKAQAISALLGINDAGHATNNAISQMTGGAKATVQTAQANPTFANIDSALTQVKNALPKVKNALDAVPTTSLSSTNKTNLSTEKSSINADTTTISGKIEAITVQKATNQNNITAAQISLTTAQNTLANAQTNLALKLAGSTPNEISAQDAQVKQAEANARNIQSQLSKTILAAPVSGMITQQDAKVGEMATPNKIIISIIADAKFEIDANIPEADIAKVKIGDTANVTLDAYGNDVNFPTKVVSIDPAETIIEGVATYKTKFQFVNEDGRIKSGLTANIDILTDQRENVLVVPQRAVITKNNEKFVLLDIGQTEPTEQKVETGLKGSDGMIEIISGLKEGDKIVSFGGEIGQSN